MKSMCIGFDSHSIAIPSQTLSLPTLKAAESGG